MLALPVEAGTVGAVGAVMMLMEGAWVLPVPQDMGQTVAVRVTVLVTAGLDEGTGETPAGRDELGALGTGITGPEAEGEPVTAGVVMAGVDDSAPGVGVSEQGTVSVSVTVPVAVVGGVTVGAGVLLSEQGAVSVSVMVPVAVVGGVEVGAEVVEPWSWQSTSPRTAKHRLMGMLIRPPEVVELCWQSASPRTARQVLMGTLIREPPLLPAEEAWSHLAWPRAATQLSTGTLIRPLLTVCCLHSTSPRMAPQRPTGTLRRLPEAWTPYSHH